MVASASASIPRWRAPNASRRTRGESCSRLRPLMQHDGAGARARCSSKHHATCTGVSRYSRAVRVSSTAVVFAGMGSGVADGSTSPTLGRALTDRWLGLHQAKVLVAIARNSAALVQRAGRLIPHPTLLAPPWGYRARSPSRRLCGRSAHEASVSAAMVTLTTMVHAASACAAWETSAPSMLKKTPA
jgi:hypothetical protein